MYFRNDYSEPCHPAVAAALAKAAGNRYKGYGEDTETERAAATIRQLFHAHGAAVYFLAGGTVTNVLTISALLRPHEAVISPITGHINVHETGAVEAFGHKILTVDTPDGKLRPADLEPVLASHEDPAKVKPRMVYISNSTEVGTIYSKEELADLSQFCKERRLLLFLDGARLGSALTSPANDLSPADLAQLVDVFYLGGTKNGTLYGEALVVVNEALQEDWPWLIKNRGAMLAKGFVPALQFQRLLETENGEETTDFKETLYFALAETANHRAQALVQVFEMHGFTPYYQAQSNQLFYELPFPLYEKLVEAGVRLEAENQTEEGAICRFVVSYSTTEEEIQALAKILTGEK